MFVSIETILALLPYLVCKHRISLVGYIPNYHSILIGRRVLGVMLVW